MNEPEAVCCGMMSWWTNYRRNWDWYWNNLNRSQSFADSDFGIASDGQSCHDVVMIVQLAFVVILAQPDICWGHVAFDGGRIASHQGGKFGHHKRTIVSCFARSRVGSRWQGNHSGIATLGDLGGVIDDDRLGDICSDYLSCCVQWAIEGCGWVRIDAELTIQCTGARQRIHSDARICRSSFSGRGIRWLVGCWLWLRKFSRCRLLGLGERLCRRGGDGGSRLLGRRGDLGFGEHVADQLVEFVYREFAVGRVGVNLQRGSSSLIGSGVAGDSRISLFGVTRGGRLTRSGCLCIKHGWAGKQEKEGQKQKGMIFCHFGLVLYRFLLIILSGNLLENSL